MKPRFMTMEVQKNTLDVVTDPTELPIEIEEEKIDPKNAMKEFGNLMEMVKEIQTDGPSWSVEKRTEKRRFFVKAYVRVFAPAIAFSGVQLVLTTGAFVTYLLGLSISGIGYTSLQELTSTVPFVGDAISKIGPTFGNSAVALLLAELSAPLLIPIGAIFTPKATESLEGKLAEWGLDADGLNKKLEALSRSK